MHFISHHVSRRIIETLCVAGLVVGSSFSPSRAQDLKPVAVDQGDKWTAETRDEFYSLDQGSRIIPWKWVRALRQVDGTPFLADNLRRYGFLPNPANADRLPVGLHVADTQSGKSFAITCAACHTRELEHDGKSYRIDGGPALIDFQSFLTDLDASVGRVVKDPVEFKRFASLVLPSNATATQIAALKEKVTYWYQGYHALISLSMPLDGAWGIGRLDAVAMIFNRLTGLDLGEKPPYIIRKNIERAEAPVRYPFIWNAWKERVTQWTGFAKNYEPFHTNTSSPWLRHLRNIGQFVGVFGEFRPVPVDGLPGAFNMLPQNSINMRGLFRLEDLTTMIDAPDWPWEIDEALKDIGRGVFKDNCSRCHIDSTEKAPWKPTVTDVDTDIRAARLLEREADTGVFVSVPKFGKREKAVEVLRYAAGNILEQYIAAAEGGAQSRSSQVPLEKAVVNERELKYSYVARVLDGVWAAAPYLHNGSVPTLEDLLKKPVDRPVSFRVGPRYDPEAVGLALEQPANATKLTTTANCAKRDSGNSRCGHPYGTDLKDSEKRALLEYLKSL